MWSVIEYNFSVPTPLPPPVLCVCVVVPLSVILSLIHYTSLSPGSVIWHSLGHHFPSDFSISVWSVPIISFEVNPVDKVEAVYEEQSLCVYKVWEGYLLILPFSQCRVIQIYKAILPICEQFEIYLCHLIACCNQVMFDEHK